MTGLGLVLAVAADFDTDFTVRRVSGLRLGYIPSMAEELITDRTTLRSREAGSLM